MANGLHRAKLCEGALAWNVWRENNPDVVPDLDEVVLAPSQRLFGFDHWGPIDLRRARLAKADLRFSCLTAADLEGANLAQARLTNALLERANLRRADLTQALLDGADLADAKLDDAVVKGANLAAARNLTQAQIERCLGDHRTTLPPGLMMPLAWLREDTLSVGRRPSRNGSGLGAGSKDATALAAEEVLKILARAKAAAGANADRKAEPKTTSGARARRGRSVRTLAPARAPKRAGTAFFFYVLGVLAAAAVAALLWRQTPPAASVKPGPAAKRVMDTGALPTLAEPTAREVPRERAGGETVTFERAEMTTPVTQAPAAAAIEPSVLIAPPPDAAAESDGAPSLDPVGILPEAESREAPRAWRRSERRAAPVTVPVKSARRPRAPREADTIKRATEDPSPHPFAARPCTMTPACADGLEFCSC